MTSFFVYVLQSESTGAYYIGQTNNVEKRVRYHNSGRNLSTKNRGPWRLAGFKSFETRAEAMKAEKKLKGAKKRATVEAWLASA